MVFYIELIKLGYTEILSVWFDKRVEYKNLMKKYGKEGNDEQYSSMVKDNWYKRLC